MASSEDHVSGADLEPSHWQRGCDDARAGKRPAVPFPLAVGWRENLTNTGYMNGWKYGKTLPRHEPAHDEGSEP